MSTVLFLKITGKDVPDLLKNLRETYERMCPETIACEQEVVAPSVEEHRPLMQEKAPVSIAPPIDLTPVPTPYVPPVPVLSNEEVDAAGVPYNPNIHSANRSKKKDGTWRLRRGLGDAEESTQQPLAPQTIVRPAVQPVAPAPVAQQPVAVPSPVQVERAAYTLHDFKMNFMRAMSDLLSSGRVTSEYLVQLRDHYKARELWDLMQNDAAMTEIYENFTSAGLITRLG